MRESGASEDAIAKFIADSTAPDDDEAEDEDVHVLPLNLPVVDTFLHCQWEHKIAPDGRIVPVGIHASEIMAAAEMMDVPRKQWPRVIQGVRIMVAVAGPQLRLRRN